MAVIRILPDQVANQIAAGEVVERPVAVVKELVENSLDAGADRIAISFRSGGKTLIRVEDNGTGMSQDQALLALERHATSKIREAKDLSTVRSFGFRGEALPSIASVSRFTLSTRAEGSEAGTEILVNGGRLVHVKACGMPVGTVVEVAQLFNSVPARRKFLKTDRTESAHIVQLCRLLAVAHPEVAFSLAEDGRPIFQSPACLRLEDRLREVFGRSLVEGLMPVEASGSGMRLFGMTSAPGFHQASRSDLHTFVNRRPVDSRTLAFAVIESYHTHVPKGRSPAAFLFLEIDPALVDVNVHPAKREVRFREDPLVRGFVIRTLIDALQRGTETRAREVLAPAVHLPQPDAPAPAPPGNTPASAQPPPPPWREETVAGQAAAGEGSPPPTAAAAPDPANRSLGSGEPERGLRASPSGRPAKPEPGGEGLPPAAAAFPGLRGRGEAPAAGRAGAASAGQAAAPKAGSVTRGGEARRPLEGLSPWRHLGALHQDYAVYEATGGLVVLNLMAARRRILFEQILSHLEAQDVRRQALLFPVALEFDPVASALLEEHPEFFSQTGFEIVPFGRQFFRLEAVPDWFDPGEAERFLRDLLAGMRERGIRPERTEAARETVARMAAEAAARQQSALGENEAGSLVRQLFSCRQPLSDPEGRPTFFEITHADLRRRFGG